MRITGRQLRQIIKEEVTRMLAEGTDPKGVKMVQDFRGKQNKGFKSAVEMQDAKRELALGLKGLAAVGADAIAPYLEAGGVGGDGATSFASELASMQK